MEALLGSAQKFIAFSVQHLPFLFRGLVLTIQLTLAAGLLGSFFGLLAALGRLSQRSALRRLAGAYVTVIRGTPLLIQIAFIYYALPEFGILIPGFWAGTLALALNAGAYIAEIVRAAIQSIAKGQMEAARSLGMSYGLAMRRIILPQTFRRLTPPMVNEIVALTKDSSLVSTISLEELARKGAHVRGATFNVWGTYFWVFALYLVVTLSLSALAARLEKRLEARE